MDASSDGRRWRLPSWPWLLLGTLGLVAVAWLAAGIADRVSGIDLGEAAHPYLVVGGFVTFDALVPILPSESLLNAGSILATEEGSTLEIWKLIVAGSVGAVIGDSLLYWISRTALRSTMEKRVAQAQRNKQIADALSVLQGVAPLFIVGGRFVPGVRFVVGASMGLARYSYARFLLWDVVGAVAWASFACVSSALVATALGGQPLLSIIVSTVITTALLAVMYRKVKQSMHAHEPPATEGPAAEVDVTG